MDNQENHTAPPKDPWKMDQSNRRNELKRKLDELSTTFENPKFLKQMLPAMLFPISGLLPPLPPPPFPPVLSLPSLVTALLNLTTQYLIPLLPPPFPPKISSKPLHVLVKTFFPTKPHSKNTNSTQPIDVYSNMKRRNKDFYVEVKFTVDEFEILLNDLCWMIQQPYHSNFKMQRKTKAHKLTLENRFLMVLIWMADNSKYGELVNRFGVSSSTISREIHHIIPIIAIRYQSEICWPDLEMRNKLRGTMSDLDPNAFAKADFTTHKVAVPQFMEHTVYRVDKGIHCLSSFAVTDFTSHFLDFETGFAHNNDTYMFSLTNVGKGLLDMSENDKILVDGGIRDPKGRLLGPYDFSDTMTSRLHKAERVGIETDFKNLKAQCNALKTTFRLGLDFQPQVALAAACLYNKVHSSRLNDVISLHAKAGITDFLDDFKNMVSTEDTSASSPAPSSVAPTCSITESTPTPPSPQVNDFPASPESEREYFFTVWSEYGRCYPSTIVTRDPLGFDMERNPLLEAAMWNGPEAEGWATSYEESLDKTKPQDEEKDEPAEPNIV